MIFYHVGCYKWEFKWGRGGDFERLGKPSDDIHPQRQGQFTYTAFFLLYHFVA